MVDRPVDTASIIEVHDSRLCFGERTLSLPNLSFRKELGRGAHGAVFEAYDEALHRPVAVKVWKRPITTPGTSRAQAEISKLAQLSHPLLVTVYNFSTVSDIACATMELVPGQTANAWLSSNPSTEDRCALWSLLSSSLRHIYLAGRTHGDPHTGNILVFTDPIQASFYKQHQPSTVSLAIKVADIGSSLLWTSHDKFLYRESRVVLETATRLFNDVLPLAVLDVNGAEHHFVLINILDSFCEYLAALNDASKGDHADTVGRIVEAVTAAPFFRLTTIFDQLQSRHIWGIKHVFRRIGAAVDFDHDCFWDSPFEPKVIPQIENQYKGGRESFIERCLEALPQAKRWDTGVTD